jgi:hypothetical protein
MVLSVGCELLRMVLGKRLLSCEHCAAYRGYHSILVATRTQCAHVAVDHEAHTQGHSRVKLFGCRLSCLLGSIFVASTYSRQPDHSDPRLLCGRALAHAP